MRIRTSSVAKSAAAAALLAFTATAPALAQDPPLAPDGTAGESAPNRVTGSVILGAAAIPRYEGSSDYRAFPAVLGIVRLDNRYVDLQATGLRANILNHPNFAFGPALSYTFGRGGRQTPDAVRALGRIGGAVELGGFVGFSLPAIVASADQLSLSAQVTTDVSGEHDGTIGILAITYRMPVAQRLFLAAEGRLSFADDAYARHYFSVSRAGSAASGLAAFDARGGGRDVGAALSLSYAIDSRWSVVAFGSYRRLLRDFADSPVVSVEGSADQFAAGAGIGITF